MKNIPVKIENGKLVFNEISLARFKEYNNGKWCDVVVRTPERSMNQLAMYRAWLTDVANHTGNDTEALHEYLLEKLAPRKIMQLTGPKGTFAIEQKKRTSGGHALSMNKSEMAEYMEKAAILTEYPLPTREQLEAMGYILNN